MPSVVVKSTIGQPLRQEIHARSHVVISDLPSVGDLPGNDEGPNPTELFLGALGACVSATLQAAALRRRWDLRHVTVTVSMQEVKDPTNPGTVTFKLVEQIEVSGNLSPEQMDKLNMFAHRCHLYKALTMPKEIIVNLSRVDAPPAVPPDGSAD